MINYTVTHIGRNEINHHVWVVALDSNNEESTFHISCNKYTTDEEIKKSIPTLCEYLDEMEED